MKVVHQRLQFRTTSVTSLEQTHLLRLFLIEFENHSKRDEDDGLDDAKRTHRPPPRGDGQEGIGTERSGKGSADERRRNEAPGKGSVTQTRSIRDEDVQDEVDGIVANPVQDVARSVAIGAITRSDDDDAQEVDAEEGHVRFCATPDIEQFRNGQLQHTADDGGQNLGSGVGRSGLEARVGGDGGIRHD